MDFDEIALMRDMKSLGQLLESQDPSNVDAIRHTLTDILHSQSVLGQTEDAFKLLKEITNVSNYSEDIMFSSLQKLSGKMPAINATHVNEMIQNTLVTVASDNQKTELSTTLANFAHNMKEPVDEHLDRIITLSPWNYDKADAISGLDKFAKVSDETRLQILEKIILYYTRLENEALVKICTNLIDEGEAGLIFEKICAGYALASLSNNAETDFDLAEFKTENYDLWRKVLTLLYQPPSHFLACYHHRNMLPGKGGAEYLFQPEGLTSFGEKQMLKNLLPSNGPSLEIVELGSFCGNGSTPVLLEIVKRQGGTLHCIDDWPDTEGISTFRMFTENQMLRDVGNSIHSIHGMSFDQAHKFRDQSLDMVFIDAGHSYDMVKKDMLTWMPKIKPGGILCGHDCRWYVDDFGRKVLEDNVSEHGMASHMTEPGSATPENPDGKLIHFHPGVILAVDEVLKGDYAFGGKPDGIWFKRM
jgi:hypothetical protein